MKFDPSKKNILGFLNTPKVCLTASFGTGIFTPGKTRKSNIKHGWLYQYTFSLSITLNNIITPRCDPGLTTGLTIQEKIIHCEI